MSRRYDCSDPQQRAEGIEQAAQAARRGELIVLPTDTVYGIGCDAFKPAGVADLLAAKGRGRDMPVPVLVGSTRTVSGLTGWLSFAGERLTEAFWPGALTIVIRQAASLAWDLGDTDGSVAVRMPLHPVAIELLNLVGPMAVSSANRSGESPATTADQAQDQLGDSVAVYLDGGPCRAPVPSTIVDVTQPVPRVLRVGAISVDQLREVCPDLEAAE